MVVDPILGDEPKGLYLTEEVAVAVRDRLVPLADVLTPNRFELGWLTGRSVATLADVRAAAAVLTGAVGRAVLVTSPPIPGGDTGVLAVGPGGDALFRAHSFANVPNGAGDAFSAMIAAGLTVGAALGHLQALGRGQRRRRSSQHRGSGRPLDASPGDRVRAGFLLTED